MRRYNFFLFLILLSALYSSAYSGVTVHGNPDLIYHSPVNENNVWKSSWQVSLQVSCSGASNPRIGWGPTRVYFAAPYEKDGTLIEVPSARSFGYGEQDKTSVTLLSDEYTVAGARVFPMTEFIKCVDMDKTTDTTMVIKDVKGEMRSIPPGLSYLNKMRYARPSDNPKMDANDPHFVEDSDEELNPENIKVGKFVTQCFLLNMQPKMDESFQLMMKWSASEMVLRRYEESTIGQGPCVVFMLPKPGRYMFFLRWQPYGIDSMPIPTTINAVAK